MMALFFGYIIAGLLASGILLQHKRLFTLLAAGGILAEGFWLLVTLIDRSIISSVTPTMSDTVVFTAGLLIIFLGLFMYIPRWKLPYAFGEGSGRRDLYVLIPLFLVLGSASLVLTANGFRDDYSYIQHGFYNGDTTTFVSLVQKSFTSPNLVHENPFSGNGSLEYPTLLHGAVATAFSFVGIQSGDGFLHFLGIMTYVQLFLTVPLFFLLWDLVTPEPKKDERWFGASSHHLVLCFQVLITLLVMGLSWDGYIYPQSHFFLTGLFLLFIGLLIQASQSKTILERISLGLAILFAIVLMRANAVTGTAAIGITATYFLYRAFSKRELVWVRVSCLAAAAVLAAVFILFKSGQPAFGFMPHFSFSSTPELIQLGGLILLTTIGFFMTLGTTNSFLPLASVVLMLMSCMVFYFSQRAIITANASRFLYHAALVGFPFALLPLVRTHYLIRKQLAYSTRTIPEYVIGYVSAITVLAALFVLPVGTSVLGSFFHLLKNNEQTVTPAMRVALWWIQDSTSPDAVFAASPQEPWAIPYFTGRSLLRVGYKDTAYWLSKSDNTWQDVQQAFIAHDKDAQDRVGREADYLLLTKDEREFWEPLPYTKVLDTNAIVIYQLR